MVSPVEDALVTTELEAKILDVKVFRNRSVEEPREKVVSTEGVVFPAICRRSVGVATPIPMFPLERTVKSETPVEDATLNGLRGVPVEDCTLRAKDDEVALMPATVPLSSSEEVPNVVAVSHRVA